MGDPLDIALKWGCGLTTNSIARFQLHSQWGFLQPGDRELLIKEIVCILEETISFDS
jgi:hypothetical protein